MSKIDFDQMTKIKDGFMFFNSFLSISKDRDVSVDFTRCAPPNSDMVGILFITAIGLTKSVTPFALIVDVSDYQDAENDRRSQVELILTSNNDKDLRVITDRIQKEADSETRMPPTWSTVK